MKIKPIICRWFIAAWLSFFSLLLTHICYAEPVPEYKIKVAFLYNFIQLTEWPKSVEDSLRLCTIGKNEIDEAINEIDGNEANRRHIKVIHLETLSAVGACEVLYLGETELLDIKSILNKLGDAPVLTVSDNLDLMKSGVMINMYPENHRLAFSVNVESAKHAHLTLSSRLVRLAKHTN